MHVHKHMSVPLCVHHFPFLKFAHVVETALLVAWVALNCLSWASREGSADMAHILLQLLILLPPPPKCRTTGTATVPAQYAFYLVGF